MVSEEKVRENYLRRQAKRLGLLLKKSKAKKWSGNNQGGYMIIEAEKNFILWGDNYGLNIDDVEGFLNEYEEKLKKESGIKN